MNRRQMLVIFAIWSLFFIIGLIVVVMANTVDATPVAEFERGQVILSSSTQIHD